MFYSGQKVICVDAKERLNGPTGLIENETYTILCEPSMVAACYVVEVDPHPCQFFHEDRFRPALTKKTDISIFNKSPVLEDA